jgi:hypothetical protein
MPPQAERSAVLIVRVWLGGEDGTFRARLTQVGDLGLPEVAVATTSDEEGVVLAVRRWLRTVHTDR